MSFDLKKFLIENQLTTNSRIGEVKVNKPSNKIPDELSHILLDANSSSSSIGDWSENEISASEVYQEALACSKDVEEDFEYDVNEQDFVSYFSMKIGMLLDGDGEKYKIGGTKDNPTIQLIDDEDIQEVKVNNPKSEALKVLNKFKVLNWNDPNLQLDSITDEAFDLKGKDWEEFIDTGIQMGLINSREDGWVWINPKTGEPIE